MTTIIIQEDGQDGPVEASTMLGECHSDLIHANLDDVIQIPDSRVRGLVTDREWIIKGDHVTLVITITRR